MTITFNISNLTFQAGSSGDSRDLSEIKSMLGAIAEKTERLLTMADTTQATLQDAMAALKTINDSTDQQAAALKQEGDNLKTVSDNQKALVAQLKAMAEKDANSQAIFQPLIDGIVADAAKTKAIADSIQAHADFSKQLASQGATNPVPAPVPVATPATNTAGSTDTTKAPAQDSTVVTTDNPLPGGTPA